MGTIKILEGDTTLTISDTTGEILDRQMFDTEKKKKFPKYNHKKWGYLGIDTPHPSECVTKTDLKHSLKAIDGYSSANTEINHALRVGDLESKLLTVKESILLKWLCENVTGWSYVITSRAEIKESLDVSSKDLSVRLRKLSNGHIRITHENTPKRGDLVIKVNPAYCWKGGGMYRNMAIENWLTSKTRVF